MHCDYLPQDYATRMDGGIAFYDGEPYLLHTDGTSITLYTLEEVKFKKISPSDPLLDLSSPRLGYVNWSGGAYYVYRKPERKYKQTLHYGSCACFDPTYNDQMAYAGKAVRVDHFFLSSAFQEMLLDKYPTLTTALKNLSSKSKAVAISRNVALAKDSFGIIRVFYKMEEVGYIKPNEGIVHVPNSELSWIVSKYLSDYNWVVV